jgi:hypothetical protein
MMNPSICGQMAKVASTLDDQTSPPAPRREDPGRVSCLAPMPVATIELTFLSGRAPRWAFTARHAKRIRLT